MLLTEIHDNPKNDDINKSVICIITSIFEYEDIQIVLRVSNVAEGGVKSGYDIGNLAHDGIMKSLHTLFNKPNTSETVHEVDQLIYDNFRPMTNNDVPVWENASHKLWLSHTGDEIENENM